MTIDSVEFFADPCCPWTWNTSRWLVEAADLAGVAIIWRTLSLAELNKDREVPDHFKSRLSCSRRMARALEALRANGRNDEMAALFATFGSYLHHDEQSAGDELIATCANDCGIDLEFVTKAINDDSWDLAIESSVAEAMALAGPDVGSPVIGVPQLARGYFGPIVSPPPTGDDALALWNVLIASFELPTFFELKRGRRDPVVFGPRS
ncbi:MAG: DsbA family protein [Acidimicrobiales bacterium]